MRRCQYQILADRHAQSTNSSTRIATSAIEQLHLAREGGRFSHEIFFSTPESGTLRTTWVTPATLWISYPAAIGWIVIALLAAFHYSVSIPPWVDLPIVGISSLLGISCAAIAGTGTLQRIHSGDLPTSP